MNLPLVQILVVVANIQVETLKVEVGKGFMRTAIDHELVGPKAEINLVNYLNVERQKNFDTMPKGNLVKIPEPIIGDKCGNTNEINDFCTQIGESYLFLLTDQYPWKDFSSR